MSVTLCEHCGEPIGAPHRLTDEDCILGHADHQERFKGYTCKRHYHWINSTLQEIAALFALVDDVIVPGPADDTRHGTRVGSPAPGRVEIMALTDPRAKTPIDLDGEDDIPDLPGALASWARIVVEERRTTDQLDGSVSTSVDVLRRERQWIVGQPWVDDYAVELAALHQAVARAVGATMWPRPIGKCPNCAAPMYPTIGVDEARCGRCRASWRGLALARLRLIHEQDRQTSNR